MDDWTRLNSKTVRGVDFWVERVAWFNCNHIHHYVTKDLVSPIKIPSPFPSHKYLASAAKLKVIRNVFSPERHHRFQIYAAGHSSTLVYRPFCLLKVDLEI